MIIDKKGTHREREREKKRKNTLFVESGVGMR